MGVGQFCMNLGIVVVLDDYVDVLVIVVVGVLGEIGL